MHKILSIALLTLGLNSFIFALPLDVSGSFYVDSTYISNYRGTDQNLGTSANAGSQEIPVGSSESALFQNYLFRLNPNIIVNDSVTIKGEITNGGLRGGFLGDDASLFSSGRAYQSLYINNAAGNNNLTLNQAYAEIYSNAALFKVGRFAKNWGLGMVINDGLEYDDRFFTVMDGVEATFQFQKFSFTPYWARISSGSKQTADDDVRELGLSVLFDDKDQDLKAGLHISQRKAESNNVLFPGDNVEIKLYDLYIEKKWQNFELALEAPFMTGKYNSQDISSMAAIVNAKLNLTKRWSVKGLIGHVSGQDDSTDVTAMGLHPNFQIAHLLFRYNYRGVEGNSNIFDSNISNAIFAKIAGEYVRGNWSTEIAFIFAKANEAAETGKSAYNHTTGEAFTAAANQESDMGYELDFTAKYQWYPNVNVTAKIGYLALGDYYAYTDSGLALDIKNPWTVSLGLGIDF